MPADVGNQTVTIRFYTKADSKNVNVRHKDIRPVGIYSGGYLSIVDASNAQLSTLVCEITDSTHQVRIGTALAVNIAVALATPYVILRWVYTGAVTDYMQILAVAAPLTNDLVVGKCSFTGGGDLQGFDYSERSTPDVQCLFLKVEPTEDTELRVRIRAGRIQNGKQTISIPDQKSNLFVPPGANKRIDLVYINRATGAIVIDNSGIVAAIPTPPNYSGKLVIAEVTLTAGDTDVSSSMIRDVRDFTNMSYDVDGLSIEVNANGKLAAKGGVTVQVVNFQTGVYQGCATVIPIDDTVPQNTEGDEVMALSITPTSASNKLIVEVVANAFPLGNYNDVSVALFRDTNVDAVAAACTEANYHAGGPISIRYCIIAGTTLQTTFRVRVGPQSAGIAGFNGYGGSRKFGGVCLSSITISEVR